MAMSNEKATPPNAAARIEPARLAEIRKYLQDTVLGYEAPNGRKFGQVVGELLASHDYLARRVDELEELLTSPG